MTTLKKKKKCFSLKVRFFLLVLLLSLVHQPDDRSKARLKSPRPKGESPPISKMPLQKGFRPFTHPFSSQPAACCESHPVGWWDVSSVRVRCGTAPPTQSHGSNQAGRTVPWHWEPASKPTDLSVCLPELLPGCHPEEQVQHEGPMGTWGRSFCIPCARLASFFRS